MPLPGSSDVGPPEKPVPQTAWAGVQRARIATHDKAVLFDFHISQKGYREWDAGSSGEQRDSKMV